MTPDRTAAGSAGSHHSPATGHFQVFWTELQPGMGVVPGWYWGCTGACGGAFGTSAEALEDAQRMLGGTP